MLHKMLEVAVVVFLLVIATKAILGALLPFIPWLAFTAIALFFVMRYVERHRSW